METEASDTPGRATASPVPHPLAAAARRDNLKLWNAWTKVHEVSAFYDVEGFRAGTTSLFPLELEELGPAVHEGITLLHLQCHFGLDTLSWARMGAEVAGVDISDEAIALARRLADDVGLTGRAEFICSDICDADERLDERLFDVVFVSWGALEWLPDLAPWARLIARRLKPGGLVAWGWEHSMSQIVGSLLDAGLRLEQLHEHPFAPAPFWDWPCPSLKPVMMACCA